MGGGVIILRYIKSLCMYRGGEAHHLHLAINAKEKSSEVSAATSAHSPDSQAATHLPHNQPRLREVALIPSRADCVGESDFALYTNTGPVCSQGPRSPKTGYTIPPGC